MEEYFAGAERASVAYDDTTGAIFDAYRSAVADALAEFQDRTADAETSTIIDETAVLLEVTVSEVTKAFEQAEGALDEFIAEMSSLDPPDEVASAHDTAVAALQRSRDSIPELIDSFAVAQSLDDISAAINGSTFGDTQPRVDAACRELERLAVDAGLTTDLRCGGSGA